MLAHVHTGGSHHHNHGHIHEHADIRPLRIAIALTGTVFVAQVIGGFLSGSLALLSDAGHVLIDLASLLIAFFGLRIAAKARNEHNIRYTFGLRRIEILAALTNGFLLIGICIYIVIEAVKRLVGQDVHIHAESMLAVAVVGFIANAISALYLHRSQHITTRSAYLHVITDLLSSAGVIVAGVVLAITDWTWVDPAISILIAILITRGAVVVIQRSAVILMESAPEGISPLDVRAAVEAMDGITDVHDIHVWQLSENTNTASVHVVSERSSDEVVRSVQNLMKERFGVDHVTVQVESKHMHDEGGCGAC